MLRPGKRLRTGSAEYHKPPIPRRCPHRAPLQPRVIVSSSPITHTLSKPTQSDIIIQDVSDNVKRIRVVAPKSNHTKLIDYFLEATEGLSVRERAARLVKRDGSAVGYMTVQGWLKAREERRRYPKPESDNYLALVDFKARGPGDDSALRIAYLEGFRAGVATAREALEQLERTDGHDG
jgi:hypothetical protein